MCLTDVGRVVSVSEDGGAAVIESGGRRRTVSLAVLALEGTQAVEGQWLRVHTGLAVDVIDEVAATDALALVAGVDVPPEAPPERRR